MTVTRGALPLRRRVRWLDSRSARACTKILGLETSSTTVYLTVSKLRSLGDPVIRRARLRIRKRVRRWLRKMDHTSTGDTACWRRSTRGTSKKYNSFQTQSSTTRRNRLLQRRAKSEVTAVVLNASNLVNMAVTVATDLSTTTCILGGRIGHLATRHNHCLLYTSPSPRDS